MNLPLPTKPMLSEVYDPAAQLFPCWVQPKLNGIRGIYHPSVRRFHTRQGKWWSPAMTEHFLSGMDELFCGIDCPIDGEFYRPGWPLQRIAGAMAVARVHPNEDTMNVEFYAFDIVSRVEFSCRQRILEGYYCGVAVLRPGKVYNHKELDEAYEDYLSDGYEGIMIRAGGAPYIHGRTHALLKRKPAETYDALCIGITEGKGQHKGKCGALLVKDEYGRKYKVGGGLPEYLRNEFWVNPPIGQVVTCSTEAGCSASGIPVQAHFVCLRMYE